ncbi:META domain-containing protein [Rhizobacter sp. AJA081-3]|uniref:META domain-containing protein n=1 Tax=Rhizobacter sp. AJA081-3 TaxID=2753607 RepID=UPI001AE025D0|nr:META domain-containing protein [Rhizobacter sp. AJA081-3]QTN24017.1 META domain-containing protein [Rhizobacter sp. AJA081-3]
MRLILCTLALSGLAACAAAPGAEPPAPPVSREVHGTWVIEQARTEPILDKRRARLVLGADGRLSGHTSCNAMNGPYSLSGDTIKIGAIATTRMACGPLLLEQEDRILTALELAATARVRPDGLLELRDADGRGVLRATRAPAQP